MRAGDVQRFEQHLQPAHFGLYANTAEEIFIFLRTPIAYNKKKQEPVTPLL